MLRSAAVALLSVGTALAVVKTADFRELIRKNDATIPDAFIVELSSPATKRAADVHAGFLGELDKRAAGKFSTRKKYNSPLFNGIAVQLENPEDLASIASIPNVVAVRPIQIYHAPKTINRRILSGPNDPNAIPFGQSTHYMTGVDHVHKQGITGKGVKIGIIDTGVDYLHPNLGGAFGPGNKVAGGYDFVGDNFNGVSPPVPDDDPRDTCIGHGTHVAGIVGANPGNDYNISGVAFDATILAYRVFSCVGVTTDDIIADAMLRAYSDGADVITMSLGGVDGWASSTLSVLASRIADHGRVMTISAGNDGQSGAVFTSSPATGESVISVASVQNIITTRPTLRSSIEHPPILYENTDGLAMPGQPLPIGDLPIPVRALSTDPDADDMACNPMDEDLSQYAVVLRESKSCDLITQILNLEPANPRVLIVYDSPPFHLGGFYPVVYLLNKEDGAFLISEAAKDTITVTFPQHNFGSDIPNNDDGGLVSFFSSYGPSNELLFKPAVAAPGGNITSLWPVDLGSFAVDSGTSMSCPYVAGAAALLLQAKGKSAVKNIRSILQATSKAVPSSREKGAPAQTLAQAGAGLVDVFSALNAKTEVSPAELRLNDTAHWRGLQTITIKNTGKKAQTYQLSHVPARTLVSLDDTKINYRYTPDVKQVDAPANVRLSQSRVTVLPGRTATVLATITPPKNVDTKLLPIVSGWITVTGSLGDSVKVSYMGVAGSLRDAQAISTSNRMLVEFDGGLPALIPLDGQFLYSQRGARNYTREELPVFVFLMAQGSRHVMLDLIDARANISSTIPNPLDAAPPQEKRGFDWSWWWPGLKPVPSPVPTVGAIAEWRDVTRGSPFQRGLPFTLLDFPTQFVNGTDVPAGQYKLLLRALRISGNPSKASDWDVYVSQQVGILDG